MYNYIIVHYEYTKGHLSNLLLSLNVCVIIAHFRVFTILASLKSVTC